MKISKQRRCQLQAALAKLQMQIADARPELLTGSLAGRPKLPDCPTAAWTTRSDDARSKRCSALWSLLRALGGTGAGPVCTGGPSVRLKKSVLEGTANLCIFPQDVDVDNHIILKRFLQAILPFFRSITNTASPVLTLGDKCPRQLLNRHIWPCTEQCYFADHTWT